ncbi:elongation factor Ts [Patescibacteria group bacterium AH-259-L05]|nr:elongation factor Ts [Patescibacteria group bacterium AH-259-L05]
METKIIQQLRETTGAGILDCQKALKESKGDFDIAIEILRKKGQKMAQAKGSRATHEGIIDTYIHSNQKMGAMVAVVCETDFVARNQEFKELVHDLSMQVAAANPMWVSSQDVPQNVIEKEREVYLESIDKHKDQKVKEKIIQGKLQKFYTEVCLLNQPFIKDDSITTGELVEKKIATLGENIQVKQFVRFSL